MTCFNLHVLDTEEKLVIVLMYISRFPLSLIIVSCLLLIFFTLVLVLAIVFLGY